ncbi:lytic transglycosylase domain-containing protein [Agaricicola taiwanensis]|nr:lytic transglycosylase domain-containing protein [Agaricicola taiwanensis]
MLRTLCILITILSAQSARAMEDGASTSAPTPPATLAAAHGKIGPGIICDLIALHAGEVGMSADFFARLIWKESRFDTAAISPVGARGIAQFMPYTAQERGLADPFDLSEAIRHSALYLRDLKADFGNWGLAAAAYNGGPNRVRDWLSNGGSLPFETEDYVFAITTRSADWFRDAGREIEGRPLSEGRNFAEACRDLPIMRTRALATALNSNDPAAPLPPWGVQVAGNPNSSAANSMYRRTQSRHATILEGRKPIVLKTRTGKGRRTIFAIRVGATSRSEAERLCNRLRRAGGACSVMRN